MNEPTYRHLLAAVDFSSPCERLIQKAMALAKACDAALSVVHVVEYAPIDPTGEGLLPGTLEVTDELRSRAEAKLAKWCQQHQLSEAPRLLGSGSVKGEIVRLATEHNCDLIVIGSHERHGLRLLFGSTEDSVRHAAPCDVLAVKLDT